MRRFPSGTVDQVVYFVAVDATDLKTRETGLSSFTVYRARNGAAAAPFTTPTVAEVSSSNMPGVYSLLLDEDMTIAAGNTSEEMVLHITQASMAPVTLVIEIFRPIITEGNTLDVNSSGGAEVGTFQTGAITAAAFAAGAIDNAAIAADAIGASELAAGAVTEIQSGLATSSALATLQSDVTTLGTYVDTEVASIKAKTDNLPAAPAAVGDIPTASQNGDALLAKVIETGFTVDEVLRLIGAALAGKLAISGSTYTFRSLDDSADRIVATVDGTGRTATTLTP